MIPESFLKYVGITRFRRCIVISEWLGGIEMALLPGAW